MGNICRSPMAEGLLIERLRQEGRRSLTVSSAGIFANPGNIPDPLAIQVALEAGIDISGYRARVVNGYNLKGDDIFLVMESGQKGFITIAFPPHSARVVLLGNFKRSQGGGGETADPYGDSLEDYRTCFEEIREAFEVLSNSSPPVQLRGIFEQGRECDVVTFHDISGSLRKRTLRANLSYS